MDKNKDIMKRDYLAEITEILISDISNASKKELLTQYHESDIAEVLDSLEDDKRQDLYKILDIESFGEVLLYSEEIVSS